MFSKFLTPVAGAALLVASTFSAQAATTTFDFTIGTTGNLGESEVVTSGTTSLTAYGFANFFDIFNGSLFAKADVHRNGNGFGVKNSRFDSNQIDNFGGLDYLVLDLNVSNWIPESALFSNFNGSDDYQIFGFDGEMDLDTDASDFAANLSSFTLLLSDDENPAIFNTNDTFRYIVFSGTPGFLQFNDNYRVASFTGTIVPLPAALPLLATGLAGFGLLSWRRRRQRAA